MMKWNLLKRFSLTLGVACALGLWGVAVIAQGFKVNAQFVPRREAKETLPPEPERLMDIVRLKVDADSGAGVARVVFEVDDQFRVEVKKPPYVYNWDTLDENDGEHTISVIAYNANGQTGTMRLKVKVENRLSLGIAHWANAAIEALRRGDERELERASRKAYRISTAQPESIRVMALYVGIKGDLGRAFQMLNDPQSGILKEDPITKEVEGFLKLLRGCRNPDPIQMLSDLREGMDTARVRATQILEALNKKTPDTSTDVSALLARGDVLWTYNRYDDALKSYERVLSLSSDAKMQRRVQLRLGMTLLRLGRSKEAENMAKRLNNRLENTDETAKAFMAAILFHQRKYVEARRLVDNGVEQRNVASLVVASLADLVLGAQRQSYRQVAEAVRCLDGPETQYVAQAVLGELGDKNLARTAFALAVMNSPLATSTLTEFAYQRIALDNNPERFQHALNLFDMALQFDSENAGALAGRSICLLGLKRFNGFKNGLDKLANLDPLSPDLFVMLAADLNRDPAKIRTVEEALARAEKMDSRNFKGKDVPKPEVLAARMMRIRRSIPLTPSLLDRADAPPPAIEVEPMTAVKP